MDPERIEYQKDIENPFTVPSSQQNKKDFRDPALWIQDNKVIKMIIAANHAYNILNWYYGTNSVWWNNPPGRPGVMSLLRKSLGGL